jgi:hypothetical protein
VADHHSNDGRTASRLRRLVAWPGGAVRSAEVTARGFLTDLGSAFYSLGAASLVLAEWTSVATVLPVAATRPGDGQVWRDWVGQWQRIRTELLETVLWLFPGALQRPAGALDGRTSRICGSPACSPSRRTGSPQSSSVAMVPGCSWRATRCTPTSDPTRPAARSSDGCCPWADTVSFPS